MDALIAALTLAAGYNTTLVMLGAAILGASAGAIGSFVLLRKRSLMSDAVSHATLPGLALAFIAMAAVTGDGRWLPGLLAGAALSSALGLLLVDATVRYTRLTEDVGIGAVLSVFFGAGVVLLTVIQSLPTGRQAGLSAYLLGSTAGMLRSEAELIAVMAALVGAGIFCMRRRFTLVCFDEEYAAARGLNVRATDLALMALLLAVTVIGLKVAGLVLIVALSIIPAVAARFWTERAHRMTLIAAGLGALGAYVGAALSSVAPGLPTGSLIVLVSFGIFLVSLVLAPTRGVLARVLERLVLRWRVHQRQGLLALARGEPIYDGLTLKVLRRAGYIRRDGVATARGQQAAAGAVHDEALWAIYRRLFPDDAAGLAFQGLVPIAQALPPDAVAELERQHAGARGAG